MIWCDLDETLIHTWRPLIWTAFMAQLTGVPISSPPADGERGYRYIDFPNGKKAIARLRPGALEFLTALRALGPVCMLTSAERDYALRMNDAFGLGFSEKAIVSCEEMSEIERCRLEDRVAQDPTGVLVENEESGDGHMRQARKMTCLGIDHQRVVSVPEYTDRDDNDVFATEFPRYVEAVKALQSDRSIRAAKKQALQKRRAGDQEPSVSPIKMIEAAERKARKR